MTPALPPLALYVHLPWCVQKCPYCDFNSHPLHEALPADAYGAALLRDLDWEWTIGDADTWRGRELVSVFFGGGTPSLFPPETIAAVLEAADSRFGLAADCEITLEANPGTVDVDHFRGYRAAGVNRLSLGVQSFDDAALGRLGRIHDGAAARAAFETARAAGFDNVNLDLMFALPGQDMAGALADLDAALALAPEHISYYHLTLEPNTAFAAAPPVLPDEDTAAAMLDAGGERLTAGGYAAYETSAWARPGRQCRHNRHYWRFGDYIGIGAGAHGKISSATDEGLAVERRVRQRHPRRYMPAAGSAAVLQDRTEVAREARAFEFAMNALRLHDGFAWPELEARTALRREEVAPLIARAQRQGLLEVDDAGARPTALGRAHLNTLLGYFL